ncbi:AMP-binding protein [Amycolatopsis anabasis]|uniref:AMP-binding protein n=1 Tax=Amycolatopsis anabasis TaxID=1840409 RepID=UPI00131AC97C|nr:AMP-binding protein [Amycolatopsis anabasis]
MNIATLLHQAAVRAPEAPAVCEGATVLRGYAELAERATAIGAELVRRYGLSRGDRVALAMSNTPLYFEVLFGAWWAGLVVTPMNARLHPAEFAFLIEDCAAGVCVTTGQQDAALREQAPAGVAIVEAAELCRAAGTITATAPAEVRPEDPAWLFYTSGTTGRPKGATLTHRNLMAATLSALADVADGTRASLLHIAPLSHAGGLFALAFVARARAQVLPRDGVVDARSLGEAIRAFGPVSFFAVPTILRRLLDPALFPDELIPHVCHILYGGAPTYAEDLRRVIGRFGAERLWQGYGQGESPGTITFLSPADHAGPQPRLGGVGVARTGVEVRIATPDGRVAPPGTVGEIVVRGDTVMAGYWNRPQATADALRNGWLHTGDLGRLDERGYLTLVDRAKSMIISGGSNIYPREVEEVLLTHPAVAEVAVVGTPDPEWGELPVAFTVLTPGEQATAEELDAHCLSHMARYKRPRRYLFTETLPKNNYGKVLKRELAESLRGKETGK